ncbi:hypothetical protein WMY93_013227 [Mugilogobius chulae]|uniref:Uncharacterized protein n=1 Tax=Mugilogobius chulae TaxID=88201 RepID=A0AAW0P5S4_9GOBI
MPERPVHRPPLTAAQVHMPALTVLMPPLTVLMPALKMHMPPLTVLMPALKVHMPPLTVLMPALKMHMPPLTVLMPALKVHMPPLTVLMPPLTAAQGGQKSAHDYHRPLKVLWNSKPPIFVVGVILSRCKCVRPHQSASSTSRGALLP